MLRRPFRPFRPLTVAALCAATLLAGCDGQPVDTSGARYDIVWTWVGGDVLTGKPGVYGTKGVAAATNKPGARHGAAQWRDAAGDFWLFGGTGFGSDAVVTGALNDLWRYQPATGLWTWMGGDAQVGGITGHSGAGIYNDADPANNLPGGRSDAQLWLDTAGDIWLFGGNGFDSAGTPGRLNDLWKFSGGIWTWVGGSDLIDQSGVYGTPNVADAANKPGARYGSTGWVDTSGNLWLFGGTGRDSTGDCCFLNDLWKFSGGQWTWVSGSNVKDPDAVYGTQNTPATANTPSGRFNASSWRDSSGNAWLYGGIGNGTSDVRFASSELWKYTASGWAWVSGTKAAYTAPVYASRGTATLSGAPGSRSRAITWLGSDNSLWLFGGDVEGASGVLINPNDLWRYKDVAWTWVGGSKTDNPSGRYNTVGGGGQPGGRAGGNGWIAADGKLWLFGGTVDDFERNDLWNFAPESLTP